MATSHTELIRKHKQILKSRLAVLNEKESTNYKLGQKNIDVLFYLNYIKFMRVLATRASEIATIEGSSEIMTKHWIDASDFLLSNIEENGTL
ncbi:hypothetical protein CANINC_000744 [Pichia inconspicua]|uniref:Uncharacterized protein n=1 Tax=Pichia inconspicua TaxID=52247 RepID=A0A4T0X6I6_9ASCO|nr:hypothetical protein CANINC_000744 [[Candida] inconspicua]